MYHIIIGARCHPTAPYPWIPGAISAPTANVGVPLPPRGARWPAVEGMGGMANPSKSPMKKWWISPKD